MNIEKYLLNEDYSKNQLKTDILHWIGKIWGDKILDAFKSGKSRIVLTEDPKHKFLMSIKFNPKEGRGMFGILLSLAPKYEFIYNPRIHSEDKDVYEKVLKHEIIHMGNIKHDTYFRELAKKHGTGASEMQLRGEKAKLEIRISPRKYETLGEFDTPEEAQKFSQEVFKNRDEYKKKYNIDHIKLRLKY